MNSPQDLGGEGEFFRDEDIEKLIKWASELLGVVFWIRIT